MTLRRVNRGDRMLTAAEQNRYADGAERALRHETSQPLSGYVRNQTSGLISIINESGANRPQGSVLEITDLLPDEISRQDLLFSAGLPSGANVPWCVTRDAVADDDSVSAYTSGTFLCRVELTNSDHTHATIINGSSVAQSASDGPLELVWRKAAFGEHLCLVRPANVPGESVRSFSKSYQVTGFISAGSGTLSISGESDFDTDAQVGVSRSGNVITLNDQAIYKIDFHVTAEWTIASAGFAQVYVTLRRAAATNLASAMSSLGGASASLATACLSGSAVTVRSTAGGSANEIRLVAEVSHDIQFGPTGATGQLVITRLGDRADL